MADNQTEIQVVFDVVSVYAVHEQGGTGFLGTLFDGLAKIGINVDLISMTPGVEQSEGFSFSASGADFSKLIKTAANMKESVGALRLMVCGGYAKVTLRGSHFPEETGVAAKLFQALEESKTAPALISSSDVSISVLISADALDKTLMALEHAFPSAKIYYS